MEQINKLLEIMKSLRDPENGCPWDIEQNFSRDTEEERGYKDYIMGYLTAFNVQLPDTYRVAGEMNLSEILAWLDDYCGLKPILAFEQSLADFIKDNYDERMKKSPSKFRR